MTSLRTAGVLTPDRPVGHLFEIRGWAGGVSRVDEVTVTIAGTSANLLPELIPGAPEGSLGWRAVTGARVPAGPQEVLVTGPDGAVLSAATVRVGTLLGEEPLWLGELSTPRADTTVEGHLVLVQGWALLQGKAASLIEVMVEGGGTVRARTRLPRPDVAAELPRFDDAAVSGFEALVPVDLDFGEERTLAVHVRYRTEGVGEVLSPVRTFTLRKPEADAEDTELADELAADTARAMARVTTVTDPKHVLVFTHSLHVGGGQLWLMELLTRMVTDHGWQVSLISESDGPLRADCAELGIEVHVTTHYRNSTVAAYEGHVAELARFAKCSGAEVALVNTLGGFGGADAAKRAGIPTAWVIHESFPLSTFAYLNWGAVKPPPAVWNRWQRTLAETDRLLFVADSTREMFLPYSKPERCRTVRYGTPMEKFGGRTRAEVRQQARTMLGYAPDDVVLLSLGIAEPRKGQGALVSAMERVHRVYPEAKLSIVGMHPTPYGLEVARSVERAGLSGVIDLVPIQPDPLRWLQAADIFVNSSDVESLPRSILEAVCCGVPVAATDVFGAREMLIDGESGWLFEPNDVDALTVALLRALGTSPSGRRDMAKAAHEQLLPWLDPAGYAREYSEILTDLARTGRPNPAGEESA
ncbi:glycosyltransferase family 4 protein [Amycolatopsis sp. H20-H5]|uniref:glycosyltransferase family 4 protein n=1 Tax=Amycolatopsis sp. H20-H5 TaxID=3046309 RepID=UPI002DB89F62|nr:glycosyltransferase family 4 protein [Amycolatopsis sp. H20-H5]MEC3981434.1 glycosyltransferase family 4 protein [Amycolatopsis sp. H20-H5]